MKRHPTLAHLSRDHHPALMLAQLLKRHAPSYKGLPNDTAGKMLYAKTFYEGQLIRHFCQEEEMMKLLQGLSRDLDCRMKEVAAEHFLIKELFENLPTEKDPVSAMSILAHALEKHIRAEERELFPLIEILCDRQSMEAVEKILNSGKM